MKNIAVLLTVFNRKNTTIECLRNLAAQIIPEGYAIDTYIVDGGSTDGTVNAVKAEFPNVNIKVCKGIFWNRGMFRAWEWAAEKDYDYYLWLNDDTFIYEDCISSLIKASHKGDDKAIIVGTTIDTSGKRKVTYGGRRTGNVLVVPNGKMEKIDFFNGNIVLVPAFVYKAIGNLDYHFTHSKGDFDYGLRAKKAGIEMFIAGSVLGECDVHLSLDKWCNPEIPFAHRWEMLHRPNGMPPKETFHLEKRHYGVCVATFHYFTIYLRCMFPNLWVNKFFINETKHIT